jgi:hypothetical protein
MIAALLTALLAQNAELDGLFDGMYGWLAKLYDPQTGGFYYALSSRNDPKFQPDIESSSFAIAMLVRADLLKQLPESMRQKMIAYFLDRQDPQSGYFLDPQNNMKDIPRMRGRALNMSLKALDHLGAKPRHPVPGAARDPNIKHLESPAAYVDWIKKRDWRSAWGALDHLQSETSIIRNLPQDRREALVDAAVAYLAELQEPDTGLWGKGDPFVRVSGAVKAAWYYHALDRKIPRPDKIHQSTIVCLQKNVPNHFCFVRNPVSLLQELSEEKVKSSPQEMQDVLRISIRNLKRFLRRDGGFSVFPDRSNPAPNGVKLGQGLDEGDLNATVQADLVRYQLYELLGEKPKPHPSAKRFLEALR